MFNFELLAERNAKKLVNEINYYIGMEYRISYQKMNSGNFEVPEEYMKEYNKVLKKGLKNIPKKLNHYYLDNGTRVRGFKILNDEFLIFEKEDGNFGVVPTEFVG